MHRNRRVPRPIVPSKPLRRNEKIVTLRRRALDEVVGSLIIGLVTSCMGLSALLFAYNIADRTPDEALEAFVSVFGLFMLLLGFTNFRKAYANWKRCETYASVLRPVERKLPVTFDDRVR